MLSDDQKQERLQIFLEFIATIKHLSKSMLDCSVTMEETVVIPHTRDKETDQVVDPVGPARPPECMGPCQLYKKDGHGTLSSGVPLSMPSTPSRLC